MNIFVYKQVYKKLDVENDLKCMSNKDLNENAK